MMLQDAPASRYCEFDRDSVLCFSAVDELREVAALDRRTVLEEEIVV